MSILLAVYKQLTCSRCAAYYLLKTVELITVVYHPEFASRTFYSTPLKQGPIGVIGHKTLNKSLNSCQINQNYMFALDISGCMALKQVPNWGYRAQNAQKITQ
jgi:hypothetical protein